MRERAILGTGLVKVFYSEWKGSQGHGKCCQVVELPRRRVLKGGGVPKANARKNTLFVGITLK